MSNDGSGTATKVALGASFPAKTQNADFYESTIYCAPNDTAVYWSITNLVTDVSASGVATTKLPSSTTLLGYAIQTSNGGNAGVCAIDICSIYCETPY